MKNLETLTTEEMRVMLKNISEILDSNYSSNDGLRPSDLQIEAIGLEFFEEGPVPGTAA